MNFRHLLTMSFFTFLLSCLASTGLHAESAKSENFMVASVNPIATKAGVDAFKAGGNAIDAAVATALTLGVVDNHNSGLGGGCFILIRLASGELVAIDGREKAPAAAHRDMYLRDGKPDPQLSQTGPLASGVPGALRAYEKAIEQGGRLKLPDLLNPAAKIAEDGFAIDRVYARKLKATAKTLARFEGSRAQLLRDDGSPYVEGDILKQPDLANTYRHIAQQGTQWFYGGEFAQQVESWMSKNGGILTSGDFEDYEAKQREPIVSKYREHTIIGFPPPSSGGVHVAQILNILEEFDLQALRSKDNTLAVHVIAEAMKLAFADRAHWLGDSDFAMVPKGLIDKEYAQKLASRINLEQAVKIAKHGLPPGYESNHFGKHTTHIATADAEGNWVAITATVNTTFGSKVIVPGTGVVLNNEMDDFSIHPGTPNAFGLVGAENNAIEPGKRPLSSMSPTIVLDQEGEPILTVGAAGGPKIITQVVNTIVYHLDFGLPLAESVASPRFHHQWLPDKVFVESTLPQNTLDALRRKGHFIKSTGHVGVTQAIARQKDGTFIGVHDPRVPGLAAGEGKSSYRKLVPRSLVTSPAQTPKNAKRNVAGSGIRLNVIVASTTLSDVSCSQKEYVPGPNGRSPVTRLPDPALNSSNASMSPKPCPVKAAPLTKAKRLEPGFPGEKVKPSTEIEVSEPPPGTTKVK